MSGYAGMINSENYGNAFRDAISREAQSYGVTGQALSGYMGALSGWTGNPSSPGPVAAPSAPVGTMAGLQQTASAWDGIGAGAFGGMTSAGLGGGFTGLGADVASGAFGGGSSDASAGGGGFGGGDIGGGGWSSSTASESASQGGTAGGWW
jgi:hypothetical protein